MASRPRLPVLRGRSPSAPMLCPACRMRSPQVTSSANRPNTSDGAPARRHRERCTHHASNIAATAHSSLTDIVGLVADESGATSLATCAPWSKPEAQARCLPRRSTDPMRACSRRPRFASSSTRRRTGGGASSPTERQVTIWCSMLRATRSRWQPPLAHMARCRCRSHRGDHRDQRRPRGVAEPGVDLTMLRTRRVLA